MTRRTIIVDGGTFCGDVSGSLPGNMTIANAVAGACGVTPPGQDLTALAHAQLIYSDGSIVQSANMRLLSNIFGRGNASQAILEYPFRPSLIQTLMPAGGHWRSAFTVPANVPDGQHIVKAVSYDLRSVGHRLPDGWQRHTVRAQIVAPGGQWDPARENDGSYRDGVAFQDQMLLTLTVGLPTSTGKAELVRGQPYELLLAFDDPSYAGGMVLQFN